MNQLQAFSFENSHQIRVVIQNGEPWFVARDVTDALGIDPSQTRRLDIEDKGMCPIQTRGGEQPMTCVNEPGLYELVLGSRKPEAREFKRWITHDVIPSIRRTGQYTIEVHEKVVPLAPDQALIQVLRTTADLIEEQAQLKQLITVQTDRINQVERKLSEQLTIDSSEQRKLQKAIARRVYDITSDPYTRTEFFRQLYREIKDRWAVPSYRDVRRTELEQVMHYVDAWRPRIA